ncbi:hypothetical protein K440DRAFT_667905 [Wilcoxina mikolae CBS 423.85]|nr:hypothetical protein K440DRAFT_667905 [Wilcoxina mikolae CBS 423.85]
MWKRRPLTFTSSDLFDSSSSRLHRHDNASDERGQKIGLWVLALDMRLLFGLWYVPPSIEHRTTLTRESVQSSTGSTRHRSSGSPPFLPPIRKQLLNLRPTKQAKAYHTERIAFESIQVLSAILGHTVTELVIRAGPHGSTMINGRTTADEPHITLWAFTSEGSKIGVHVYLYPPTLEPTASTTVRRVTDF